MDKRTLNLIYEEGYQWYDVTATCLALDNPIPPYAVKFTLEGEQLARYEQFEREQRYWSEVFEGLQRRVA